MRNAYCAVIFQAKSFLYSLSVMTGTLGWSHLTSTRQGNMADQPGKLSEEWRVLSLSVLELALQPTAINYLTLIPIVLPFILFLGGLKNWNDMLCVVGVSKHIHVPKHVQF